MKPGCCPLALLGLLLPLTAPNLLTLPRRLLLGLALFVRCRCKLLQLSLHQRPVMRVAEPQALGRNEMGREDFLGLPLFCSPQTPRHRVLEQGWEWRCRRASTEVGSVLGLCPSLSNTPRFLQNPPLLQPFSSNSAEETDPRPHRMSSETLCPPLHNHQAPSCFPGAGASTFSSLGIQGRPRELGWSLMVKLKTGTFPTTTTKNSF